jgi:hypothetical protein
VYGLSLRTCVISNNYAGDDGGGIFNTSRGLSLYKCVVARNASYDFGGGIASDGRVHVEGCIIAGNTGGSAGGGFAFAQADALILYTVVCQNTGDQGGGVNATLGRLQVRNSLFVGNRCDGDNKLGSFNGGGGGLFLAGVNSFLSNSTLSGNVDNTADPQSYTGGGGVHLVGGKSTINNCTIAFNESGVKGGGIYIRDGFSGSARLTMTSTIVSNSIAPNGNLDVVRAAGEGIVSARFSLIQRPQLGFINNGSVSNILGVNPRLLPLKNNGGVTNTHALAAGSPALNSGSNPDQLRFDQRGPFEFFRVVGGGADIGAFEVQ